MKRLIFLYLIAAVLIIQSCKNAIDTTVTSPSKKLQVAFTINDEGILYYTVSNNNKIILETSPLGLYFEEADFTKGLIITKSTSKTIDETWRPVWGQKAEVLNKAEQLTLELSNKNNQKIEVICRVFDDGLGLRYYLPAQGDIKQLTLKDELTGFDFGEDPMTWWVPGCWDNDEYPYTQSKLSEVDATPFINNYKYSNVTTITNPYAVNTPVTMRLTDGTHISIHEAALVDFPGMSLSVDRASLILRSHLAEADNANGVKSINRLPFHTPWRTITVTDNAAGLINSHLIYNLNDPNKLTDTDWIQPTKYMGIWWEMHVGKASWDLKSGKHGANTDNVKKYIDFCAANDIPALLVEGWNTGWEDWVGEDREGIFDFVTPYADYNVPEIMAYAKDKEVSIIGHHETASAVATYEKHMDAAFDYYNEIGVNAVKTGYVGKIPDHRHYDQYMVNHYNETVRKSAEHKIMINIHEPIKPTGLSRTYPNLMSGEGMRGQEFNAWSDGNKPSHNVTLPFTRNLAGPMDFTPGIFDLKLEKYKNNITKVSSFDSRDGDEKPYSRVYSTLAHQLGLYVVFYSPVQMAADLPENYDGHPAFQFIRDVAVDWDDTYVIEAEVANHVVIARKAKGKDEWFVGGITGVKEKVVNIDFNFLPEGKPYIATIYRDAEDTDYMEHPERYVIKQVKVSNGQTLTLTMKAAGGFAMSVSPQ